MDDRSGDLLYLIHDVARLMRVNFDKRARAHGMTRAQWVILIRLHRQPGLSQRELAELLEVEPITVARLIDRLAARAMLERRPDAGDRRIWRLHLLEPAMAVLKDIEVHADEILREASEGVAPAALRETMGALLKMKINLCQERDALRRGDARRIA